MAMCGEEGPTPVSPAYAALTLAVFALYRDLSSINGNRVLFWALGEVEGHVTWLERIKEMAQTYYEHSRLEAVHCGNRAQLTACSPGQEQGQEHLPGCLPAGLAPGDLTQGWLPTLHSKPYHCLTDSGYHRAGWAEDLQREASGDRKVGQG